MTQHVAVLMGGWAAEREVSLVSGAEVAKSGTQLTADQEGFNIGVSAVTGDLTVGVGFGDGDSYDDDGAAASDSSGSSWYVGATVSF